VIKRFPFTLNLKATAIAFAIAIGVTTLWPFNSVPTGHRAVITQFGKIVGIEKEGLVILPPWQKVNVFNVRAEAASVRNSQGATSDTQPVNVSMTVRYQVQGDQIASVFENYSKDGDLEPQVATATADIFKAVTAKFTATELIQKRAEVAIAINNALGAKLKLYGATVLNVDMTDFAFSESYMKAINDKVTQQQAALAAEQKLKTVEAEQKQKVAVAEAEAHALKLSADGEAYAKLANAKAEAESLRLLNTAVAQNKDVLELKRIEVSLVEANKWNGARVANQFYGSAPVQVQQLTK
jgi:regulator of protease activity HflC (stomatin/prohibitin superfamily)